MFDFLHWITLLQDYLICLPIFYIFYKLKVKCNIDYIQIEYIWGDYFVGDAYFGGMYAVLHENSPRV